MSRSYRRSLRIRKLYIASVCTRVVGRHTRIAIRRGAANSMAQARFTAGVVGTGQPLSSARALGRRHASAARET